MKVLFEDRLREKEGLFLAFVCLDYKRQGFINLDQWMKFIDAIFKGINILILKKGYSSIRIVAKSCH